MYESNYKRIYKNTKIEVGSFSIIFGKQIDKELAYLIEDDVDGKDT